MNSASEFWSGLCVDTRACTSSLPPEVAVARTTCSYDDVLRRYETSKQNREIYYALIPSKRYLGTYILAPVCLKDQIQHESLQCIWFDGRTLEPVLLGSDFDACMEEGRRFGNDANVPLVLRLASVAWGLCSPPLPWPLISVPEDYGNESALELHQNEVAELRLHRAISVMEHPFSLDHGFHPFVHAKDTAKVAMCSPQYCVFPHLTFFDHDSLSHYVLFRNQMKMLLHLSHVGDSWQLRMIQGDVVKRFRSPQDLTRWTAEISGARQWSKGYDTAAFRIDQVVKQRQHLLPSAQMRLSELPEALGQVQGSRVLEFGNIDSSVIKMLYASVASHHCALDTAGCLLSCVDHRTVIAHCIRKSDTQITLFRITRVQINLAGTDAEHGTSITYQIECGYRASDLDAAINGGYRSLELSLSSTDSDEAIRHRSLLQLIRNSLFPDLPLSSVYLYSSVLQSKLTRVLESKNPGALDIESTLSLFPDEEGAADPR